MKQKTFIIASSVALGLLAALLVSTVVLIISDNKHSLPDTGTAVAGITESNKSFDSSVDPKTSANLTETSDPQEQTMSSSSPGELDSCEETMSSVNESLESRGEIVSSVSEEEETLVIEEEVTIELDENEGIDGV